MSNNKEDQLPTKQARIESSTDAQQQRREVGGGGRLMASVAQSASKSIMDAAKSASSSGGGGGSGGSGGGGGGQPAINAGSRAAGNRVVIPNTTPSSAKEPPQTQIAGVVATAGTAPLAQTQTQQKHEEENEEDTSFPLLEEAGNGLSKVVGIQHYSGLINKKEQMILKRCPTNQYDRNAIEVHNAAGTMVGHIPKEAARVLAPLVDKQQIVVEAYTTASVNNVYSIPLQLVCFADPRNHTKIDRFFSQSTSPITKWSSKPMAQLPTGKRAEEELVGGAFQDLLNAAFTSLGAEDMALQHIEPKDAKKDVFRGSLMPYQQQAVGWMLEREAIKPVDLSGTDGGNGSSSAVLKRRRSTKDGANVGYDLERLKQDERVGTFFWTKEVDKSSGGTVYTHMLTKHKTKTPPLCPRGGILADDMGLGKTVQMLGLLSHPVSKDIPATTTAGKKPLPASPSSTATKVLIVCPLSLLRHWESHIDTFLPSYKVLVYNGGGRASAASVDDGSTSFATANVVVCTYGTVRSDHTTPGSPLFKCKWDRVLLDEAHTIKNSSSKTAIACCALSAHVRWCLTGTPLQNKLNDFYSLLKFLQFAPFDTKEYWSALVLKLIQKGDPRGPIRLGGIVKTLVLRRTKESQYDGRPILTLPPLTFNKVLVPFTREERAQYAILKKKTKAEFDKMLEAKSKNAGAWGLVLLLRMRQFCCDPSLVPSQFLVDDENTSMVMPPEGEETETLKQLLATASDATCPVCLDDVVNGVISSCRHLFCEICADQLAAAGITACPLCRTTPLCIVMKSSALATASPPTANTNQFGSKIQKTIELIQQHVKSSGGEKVVVFSQWPTVLDVVARAMKSAEGHLKWTKLVGSMNIKQRQEAVEDFSTNPNTKVMLLSKMAGGTGLNLVCATCCILFDPWWNPSTDRQAIMRIHRIGQTRPVVVHQLIMAEGEKHGGDGAASTVEENIVALQRKKQHLADQTMKGAIGGKEEDDGNNNKASSSGGGSLSLADIRDLLR